MENKLVIKGGKKLKGEVTISSSKNAAVAILPAVVLGSEIVKLYDVPHIEDVHVLIQLLQELNINVFQECFKASCFILFYGCASFQIPLCEDALSWRL